MKIKNTLFLLIIIAFYGCHKKPNAQHIHAENWEKRKVNLKKSDSLEYGKSYLSIYSQIYSISQHKTHNLTAMVSLRNTSDTDTIYLLKAEYYDTHGKPIETFFKHPIYLAPMESTDIIIEETNISGGTGSNFIFEWKIPKGCPEPLFEGIMNSTMGQQGLSFTTQAKRIK